LNQAMHLTATFRADFHRLVAHPLPTLEPNTTYLTLIFVQRHLY